MSNKTASQRWRDKKRSQGLCVICGKEPAAVWACDNCKAKTKVDSKRRVDELRARRLAAGLCNNCGNPLESNRLDKSRCLVCQDKFRVKRLAAYKADQTTRQRYLTLGKKERYRLRIEVLSHYSNGTLTCACCGDSNKEFLTVDHVNNDGKKHRKELARGRKTKILGIAIYRWLRKNNFPSGFQILCWNCNIGKFRYGECPHQTKRRDGQYSYDSQRAPTQRGSIFNCVGSAYRM